MAPLPGPEALRLFIPANTAVELVAQGRTKEMLQEARRTYDHLKAGGLEFAEHYANHVIAYEELDRQVAKLVASELAELHRTRAELTAAQEAHAAAARVIANRLGVGEGMRS